MSQQPPPPHNSNEAPYPPASGAQGVSYPPPNAGAAGYPPQQGAGGFHPQQGYAPQHQQYGIPPPGYAPGHYAAPPPPAHAGRPPLVSIISPDDAKKIRKMQIINFAATLIQLGCSLAIILIVRNQLYRVSFTNVPGGQLLSATCLAATPEWPGTCEYAYSLASVSIFVGFILSLMQCLTMDCCGAGRAIEAGFDAAASAWWIAGGITLGLRASEANAAGIDAASSRNAVVAMCWISALLFLVLLCTNIVLIKRLGKAYKAAAQQMQQHLTAMPVTGYPQGGVQMGQMGPAGGPPPGYPTNMQPGMGAQPQWGAAPPPPGPPAPGPAANTAPPAGYPSQFTPPPPAGTTTTTAV